MLSEWTVGMFKSHPLAAGLSNHEEGYHIPSGSPAPTPPSSVLSAFGYEHLDLVKLVEEIVDDRMKGYANRFEIPLMRAKVGARLQTQMESTLNRVEKQLMELEQELAALRGSPARSQRNGDKMIQRMEKVNKMTIEWEGRLSELQGDGRSDVMQSKDWEATYSLDDEDGVQDLTWEALEAARGTPPVTPGTTGRSQTRKVQLSEYLRFHHQRQHGSLLPVLREECRRRVMSSERSDASTVTLFSGGVPTPGSYQGDNLQPESSGSSE